MSGPAADTAASVPSSFEDAVARLAAASSFAQLGGAAGGLRAYREWARLVHPDAVSPALRASATEAFARLSALFAAGGAAFAGDIADLEAVDGGRALRKAPRSPRDNDLMADEAAALRRLWAEGDPKFRPYAPELLDSYTHEDAHRVRRRVNVLQRLDGFVPLSAVGRRLDWRDAAWMWRRLLVALGWAHRAGVVHGCVIEEHVLVHPGEHGLALVDWCYSGTPVRAVVAARRAAYPPEVLAERTATPATDIYMATGLMLRLTGSGLPEPLRRFADGCTYAAPRMRPQDAWSLLGELDDLLGPRTFRPFTL